MIHNPIRPILASVLLVVSSTLVGMELSRSAAGQVPVYPTTQTLYPYKCVDGGWGLCPDCDDGGDVACEAPCPGGGNCPGWSRNVLCQWDPGSPSAPTCEQTLYDCGREFDCNTLTPISGHCQWASWCR